VVVFIFQTWGSGWWSLEFWFLEPWLLCVLRDFHRCEGHLTRNCIQLKHKIQDLVDQKIIEIEEPQRKTNHGVLKNPLPNYDKGESSTPNGKDKNLNHIHDTLILHLSEVEDPHDNVEIHDEKNMITTNKQVNNTQTEDGQHFTSNEIHINKTITIPSRIIHDTTTIDYPINVIKIKGEHEQSSINATIRAQTKYILEGSTSKTPVASAYQYNIVNRLQKIRTQI
jgi:hypothetical protein